MPSSERIKGAVIGLLLSAVFLYFAVRKVDFENFSTVLISADYRYLAAIVVAYVIFYWLKVCRWRMLLGSMPENSLKDYLYPIMVGFAANNVFPFRAGEVIRVFIGSITLKASRLQVLGSIVAERLLDLVAVGAIFLIAITAARVFNTPHGISNNLVYTMTLAMIFAIGLLILITTLAVHYKVMFESLIGKILPEFTRPHILSFVSSFEHSRNLVGALLILANSLLQWLLLAICVMWSLQAVGVTANEIMDGSYGDTWLMVLAAVTMGVMVIGVSLPSTVAFIGTIEYAFVLSLGFFNIDTDHALAAGVFYHIIVFFVTTFGGFVCYLLYRWQYHKNVPSNQGKKIPGT